MYTINFSLPYPVIYLAIQQILSASMCEGLGYNS